MQSPEFKPASVPAQGFRSLLVAADQSESALRAVDVAAEMAGRYGAALYVIIAAEPVTPTDPEIALDVDAVEAAAERRLEAQERWVVDAAMAHQVEPEIHVLAGHSVRSVVAFARDHEIDLLLVSAAGHGNIVETVYSELREALVGSRPAQIVQLAPCSVMVVK